MRFTDEYDKLMEYEKQDKLQLQKAKDAFVEEMTVKH